ncbi:MAG: diguanylate cyclase [Spirochaetaceae bacterium]|nr:MAG: diguanylate cyclase [Spirochaetaceae bacterium]
MVIYSMDEKELRERVAQLEREKCDLEEIVGAYERLGEYSRQELDSSRQQIDAFVKIIDSNNQELLTELEEQGTLSQLHSQVEEQILGILDEDAENEEFLLGKFNRLHDSSGDGFFVDLFRILVNLEFDAQAAAEHWQNIMLRKKDLSQKVGREVHFRVAMLDYFFCENKRVRNPKIIEIKLFEKTLRVAMIDELTRVFNRRYYDEIIERELKRARRYGRDLSLAVIDIDDFKLFNDESGHAAGDKILASFGSLLGVSFRKEDVVCRYGGEEFVVVMPETDSRTAYEVLERFRVKMRSADFLNMVTFSCGVASFPAHAEDEDELFIKADKAMYIAKANGKDRVAVYGKDRRVHRRIDMACSIVLSRHLSAEELRDPGMAAIGSFGSAGGTGSAGGLGSAGVEGLTTDISMEGLCFETLDVVQAGEQVVIDFGQSELAGRKRQAAEIMWVEMIKGSSPVRRRVGVRFIGDDFGG